MFIEKDAKMRSNTCMSVTGKEYVIIKVLKIKYAKNECFVPKYEYTNSRKDCFRSKVYAWSFVVKPLTVDKMVPCG